MQTEKMSSSPVKRQLVVYDFDWSLVDQDTDRWVHEVLCPRLRRKLKELEPTTQFTDLCSQLLVELHAEGKTREDIENAMRLLPFHPAMKKGVRDLKETSPPETTFFLLSNSNTVYINLILEHHNMKDVFTEIVTNPAQWEGDLLRLRRRVSPDGPQHNCKVGCQPNMCKGEELEAFLSRHGGLDSFDRIVYVGDGGNDFCPVLRLRSHDVAFVRKHCGLEKRIAQEGKDRGLKAQTRYWEGAWEVEGLLGELKN